MEHVKYTRPRHIFRDKTGNALDHRTAVYLRAAFRNFYRARDSRLRFTVEALLAAVV